MKIKTVKDIIIDYLNKHDFDGLAGDDCGCEIDDLFCCGDYFTDCTPAIKFKDKTGEFDWVMRPSKRGRIK